MINHKKIVVVLPAYNAGKTLRQTFLEIPFDCVDDVILVDDASWDNTREEATHLGIKHIIVHPENRGYGANQKTCYDKALELNADIVVMLHPDYQYDPRLIPAMCSIIANDVYPVVFGSRILGKGALKGGMPLYKYIANRGLTFLQNILMNEKLSEYHTGYRAFSKNVLKTINYELNSEGFIFDNEVIAQIYFNKFEIAEITCPTKYFKEASSINFRKSLIYGLKVIWVSLLYRLTKFRIYKWKLLARKSRIFPLRDKMDN